MKRLLIFLGLIITCFIFTSQTIRSRQEADPISGTWTGTSICQVKDSPCRDEVAAYHAKKLPDQNVYRIQMNKVVNGKEEEMGPLNFSYDQVKQTLSAVNSSARGKGIWIFKLHGKAIHGTLTIDNVLFRVIELQKAN